MIKSVWSWLFAVRRGIKQSNSRITKVADATKALRDDLYRVERRLDALAIGQVPPRSFLKIPTSMEIECPVCKRGKIAWTSAYPSFERNFSSAIVLYCESCGSGHVPAGQQLIDGYYDAEYSKQNRGDRCIPPERYFASDRERRLNWYFDRSKSQVAALTELGAKWGNVLDYGSGPGYLLHESAGNNKFAVELDGDSDKYLDYLGATKISPNKLPEKFFDVIVASHVVEHFTDDNLHHNLKNMIDSLTPDGFLLIEVPNGGHTYMHPRARQDPHTLFFTPTGIVAAVEAAGARVLTRYARASPEGPANPNAAFAPPNEPEFSSTLKGGLTVIAKARQTNP